MTILEVDAIRSQATIGVAIGLTHERSLQLHTGVVHRSASGEASLLNLASHAELRNDRLPDPDQHYVWIELGLDPDRVAAVTALCRRIWRRHPSVPYGVLYEGGRFIADGRLRLEGRELGLTCATFVLSVLEGAGLHLLLLEQWPPREDDDRWHASVIGWLASQQVPQAHIAGVMAERGCARYRPEEVVGACSYLVKQWPIGFDDAFIAGHQFTSGFVGAPLLGALLAWLTS